MNWEERVVAFRRDFHKHPEVAFEEHRTSCIVADVLERAGLEVRRGVAGTGVLGVLRGAKGGRVVAWRADMDALPVQERVELPFASVHEGVMHACGHDGHTAIALVMAELLAEVRESLSGTVVFLFQPAEEVFQGARAMLREGVLEDPHVEEIYGLHLTTSMPCGTVGVKPGVMWASADGFEVEITGRGGHGAFPHLTHSPLPAAAQVVLGLPGLVAMEIQAQKSAVLSVGEMRGGSAYNIIPEKAVLTGSLRTLDETTRSTVQRRLPEYARNIVAAHCSSAEVRWMDCACPCLENHLIPAKRVEACAVETEGRERVVSVEPSMASDDMSLFLLERSGCYFKVGCAPEDGIPRPHHSPIFEIDERSLSVGVRVGLAVLKAALLEDV